MRAERLLSILLLLQVHRRMTAGVLARRLEVSERTIHRDMDALSAAGVPVSAERGSGGGWGLLGAYRTNLTGLQTAEIQALFVAKPPRLLADLGLDQAAEAGLIKLLAALPAEQRQGAEYVRQRIHVDLSGWQHGEEAIPFLPALQEALFQERRVKLVYHRADGTASERLADPLGLVAKGKVWYLVAAVDGELRTYRVGRVQDVQVLDEPCARPAGFDLVGHWEQSATLFAARLPSYLASVRASPDGLQRMRQGMRFARIVQADEPDAGGWAELSIQFQTEANAIEHLVGYGAEVEVLAPAALREQVIRTAQNIVAFYAQRTAPGTEMV